MDPGHPPAMCRILTIDDDPISLSIAAILLESDGWTVLQASGGCQALELLADPAHAPDCILADLRMPGLAGTDLALHLRRAAPGARLFAMTATPPPAVDGYDGVLAKPLVLEALRAALAHQPSAEPAPRMPASDADAAIDSAVFDRLSLAMSPSALQQVIALFLQDASARIAVMRRADLATIRREAHTIKGGAAMIGARQVAQAAAAVESGIDQDGDRFRKLDEIEAHCRRAETILLQRLKL
ncbi:MAG TPA: response regulator [Acidobacteriaceae bacterium]|nr:response regulator [Acidobacteriaceae bacterium]